MVRNQQEQSFASLTLAELLHPESADSGMSRTYSDESPWATVYYEAVAGPLGHDSMPVATNVVAVEDDDDEEQGLRTNRNSIHGMTTTTTTDHGQSPPIQQPLPRFQPWRHSNVVDLIFGFAFSLVAFITTIKIELTATIIYTIAAGFHYLAEEVCQDGTGVLRMGRSVCMILCSVLMVVDPIFLTVSLVLTELIGGLALIVCTVFGSPYSGQLWHQFIRKICHLTRWGFRSSHSGWKPERIFPISLETERSHLGAMELPPPSSAEYEELELQESYRDVEEVRGCSSSIRSGSRVGQSIVCSSLPNDGDSSTMISDVTLLLSHHGEYERPPIPISAENVTVVVEEIEEDDHHPDDVDNDDDDDPLFKNTQRVTII